MSVVSPDARSSDSEFFSRDATSSWDVYNGPGIGHLWIFFCRKKQNSERLIKARESKLPRMKEITSLLIKRIVVVSQGPSLSPAPSREGRPPPPLYPTPALVLFNNNLLTFRCRPLASVKLSSRRRASEDTGYWGSATSFGQCKTTYQRGGHR